MIPNQWYVLMDSKQIKERPVGVIRMGEKLVFWRDMDRRVVCLRDKCAHRGAQLSIGKIIHDRLQCPFHGLEYDSEGKVTFIPANGRNAVVPDRFRVLSYPTYESNGFVWVWWGDKPPKDLTPPKFFDDIGAGFTFAGIQDHWPIHYSRAIENQLDVVHLPFVHHNTIGRGNKTLVDGPGFEWTSDNSFNVYFYNRQDDGNKPQKPEEVMVPDPNSDFRLEFIFPNLWQNHLGEEERVMIAFVPVDDENTILYLRFYQKFIKLPFISDLVTWMSMPFNRLIAHQDRRVVITQQPKASGLKIGENLIQGDRPIIEYRKRRQEMKDAAEVDMK